MGQSDHPRRVVALRLRLRWRRGWTALRAREYSPVRAARLLALISTGRSLSISIIETRWPRRVYT
ncbi:hypothetical protein EJB05_31061, partial [Eragrostis curvula]